MRLTFIILLTCINLLAHAQCVSEESFTINPLGPYEVGDVVEVNYTLGKFFQLNINWVIAFQINLGDGWTNLTPIATPLNTNTNNELGNGYWIWDDQNLYPSGLNFGPGFRFVNTSWNYDYFLLEGSPDWGSSSKGPLSMSFEITVGQTCTPDDLSISVNVYGDCLTGAWNNGSCCLDPALTIYNGIVLVDSDLDAGNSDTLFYCSESDAFNLFDQLNGNPQVGGVWFPSLPSAYFGEFDPSVNIAQEYTYTVSDECNSESASMFLIEENIDAGNDFTLEICQTDGGINFFDLIGNPDINGAWNPTLGDGYLGFFDPSSNLSGLYTYNVSGECSTSQSQVDVSIIEIVPPLIISY